MSFTVFPSPAPGASSGSLLVIDVRTKGRDRPQVSWAVTVAVTVTIWWWAGRSTDGERVTEMLGADTPAQTPAWQASPVVQDIPSLQEVPSLTCGLEQPAAPPQTSLVQELPSAQRAFPPSST